MVNDFFFFLENDGKQYVHFYLCLLPLGTKQNNPCFPHVSPSRDGFINLASAGFHRLAQQGWISNAYCFDLESGHRFLSEFHELKPKVRF